jgi:hypothetical protein
MGKRKRERKREREKERESEEGRWLAPCGQKYWAQRYRLFSRFDAGALLDDGTHTQFISLFLSFSSLSSSCWIRVFPSMRLISSFQLVGIL